MCTINYRQKDATMDIKILSKTAAYKYADQMVAIDEKWYFEKGNNFAESPWRAANFLIDLKGKWDNSLFVLQNKEVLGYIIVSETLKNKLHINRIASKNNGHGIGRKMEEYLNILALKNSYSQITAIMSYSNNEAQSFFEKCGYVILKNKQLELFLFEKERENYILEDNCFYIDKNHKYIAAEKNLLDIRKEN